MTDELTTFIRSSSIYSKTTGGLYVAGHNGEVYIFFNGMPVLHQNFLHYAIDAIHPTMPRPARVMEMMNEQAQDLLSRVGLDIEGGEARRMITSEIAKFMQLGKGQHLFKDVAMGLLNDIEERAFAVNPSLGSVARLDDYMV